MDSTELKTSSSILQSDLNSRSVIAVVIESFLVASLIVVAVIGNSLTLYVLKAKTSRTTPPDIIIFNLAISDLGMATLSMPICLETLITSQWNHGFEMCQYKGIIVTLFPITSVQIMTWAALNRFVCVCRTNRYRQIFTTRKTGVTMVLSWLGGLFPSILYFLSGKVFVFHPGKFICYFEESDIFIVAFTVLTYATLPGLIIIFCYTNVYLTIRNHKRQIRHFYSSNPIGYSRRDIKTTKTLFVTMIIFVLLALPLIVIDLIDAVMGRWSLPRGAYVLYSLCGALSSTVNPIIYGIMNPAFRREFCKVIRKFYVCSKNNAQTRTVTIP
jgi:melatonin receptor type 1A